MLLATALFKRQRISIWSWAAFSLWDVADGAQLLKDESFSPLGYHPGSKEFLSIKLGGALCITTVNEAV